MEGGKAGINKNVTDRQFSSLTGGVNWPFRCLHAQPSTYCQNERAHEFFILRKSKLQIHKLPEQRLPQAACFCQLRKKTLFVFVNFKSWLPCNFIKSQTGQSYLPIKKLANMFFFIKFQKLVQLQKVMSLSIAWRWKMQTSAWVDLFSCQCLLGKQSFSGRKNGYLDDEDDEWLYV